MSDTPNFAIWHPEYDGHAPPNWKDGMGWDCNPFRKDGRVITDASPFWSPQNTYRVPPEALTAPNEDDDAGRIADAMIAEREKRDA